MRIDAYNQVAQLYGIQKSVKTQKAQNAAGREIRFLFHRLVVTIR